MGNLVSVSSAPIAKLSGSRYYDLVATLSVMNRVWNESVVDGFELQVEPEWDSENPPLSDGQFADWTQTPKYFVAKVLEIVRREKLPILSVHANRDIGGYLCSDKRQDREKGKCLIADSLSLASARALGHACYSNIRSNNTGHFLLVDMRIKVRGLLSLSGAPSKRIQHATYTL